MQSFSEFSISPSLKERLKAAKFLVPTPVQAAAILAGHRGPAAVDAFGLRDVFESGDFAPAYAFLEAQGRQAVVTPGETLPT